MLNLKIFSLLICGVVLAIASTLHAEVKVNSLFTDGAVLQQGVEIPVWGTAKDGENVVVDFDGQTARTVAQNGKWMVRLKSHAAGGPYTMTIAGENQVTVKNILVGDVWVCSGQSNMEWVLSRIPKIAEEVSRADYPKIRMLTVPAKSAIAPEEDVNGIWEECSPKTAPRFSAVGYFFGRDLYKAKGVPVGLINSSVGGTQAQAWTSLSGLEAEKELSSYVNAIGRVTASYPKDSQTYSEQLAEYNLKLIPWEQKRSAFNEEIKKWNAENNKAIAAGKIPPVRPQNIEGPPRAPRAAWQGFPTVLYNGMIAPLQPYAIKGVIWYQGESNRFNPMEYRTLFPRLITDWREKWGQGSFPFLFVQVAPYKEMPPEIREAQLLSWQKTPNTAMVVTTDVGESNNIHPAQKEPVGVRLALAARALAYGEEIEYSGPIYESSKVEGNRLILSFTHIGSGLLAKGGELKGFTIAGQDKNFLPAQAEIRGENVIVYNESVSNPTSVRYAWENVPDVNLFNKEGLPASPFRSDIQ
jgi:sialate O-acetylesterase